VTVPLGVLKSGQIQFSPPLPDWKEQAIGNLGFGLLNKLVLVFDKPFWDTSVELFGYVGSGQEGSSGRRYNLKAYRSSRGKFYMYWNCIVVSGLPVLGKKSEPDALYNVYE
jgi:lysine-specific histone demethylase 1